MDAGANQRQTTNPGRYPADEPRSRSVLFATIAAGGSHVSTAHAMSEAMSRHYPGMFELRVAEPMVEFGFGELDERHKAGWRRALRHPWSIVWGQRLIDALPAATVAFHRRLLREFARGAAERLQEQAPDLIVANHGWLTVALTLAQREYGLEVPVVTFETSTLNANALWADVNAERFVVASPVSRARLLRFGIPAHKVDVVGYPVRESFLCPPTKSEARALLGLDDDFTCLVALGGEGVGGTPEEVLGALQWDRSLQVVVVTGRNRALQERLERLRPRVPRMRVVGFVEEMAHYLAASDVVVGKTGPATVYETIAVGRPLLAPALFGEAENKMLRLLERKGLGAFVPDSASLQRQVRAYRERPERLDEVEEIARQFDFPGMSARLARYLSHYAETRQVAGDACGRGLELPIEP